MEAAEELCANVPPSVKHTCRSIVDKLGRQLIKFIETLQPDKICQLLGMCKKENAAFERKHTEESRGKTLSKVFYLFIYL